MRSDRLPVTVIYGLPGSGKTTVVSYLCDRRKAQRIALSPLYGGEAAFGHVHQLALADEGVPKCSSTAPFTRRNPPRSQAAQSKLSLEDQIARALNRA